MKWRIYYVDGSSYSDCDGALEDAPAWGVIIVAQEDVTPHPYNIGRVYRFGRDFYCWRGETWGWTGQDGVGLTEYLAGKGWKKVLNGTEARQDIYHRVKAQAEQDDYLPLRAVRNPEGYCD